MPALVGCGATVYTRGRHAGDKEAEIAEKLFSAVGFCEEIQENLIDPVTALAGSGPAYVSDCFRVLLTSSQDFYFTISEYKHKKDLIKDLIRSYINLTNFCIRK